MVSFCHALKCADSQVVDYPLPRYPSERLTRAEALKGMTLDTAYASFSEDILGSLFCAPAKPEDASFAYLLLPSTAARSTLSGSMRLSLRMRRCSRSLVTNFAVVTLTLSFLSLRVAHLAYQSIRRRDREHVPCHTCGYTGECLWCRTSLNPTTSDIRHQAIRGHCAPVLIFPITDIPI